MRIRPLALALAALLALAGTDAAPASPLSAMHARPAADSVRVNDVTLTEAQLHAFERQYGVRPQPGHYWYDATSGLYGVVGYPAFGFMLAGHDLGRLDPRASNGDTGVYINGRQLPQSEWLVWSQLLGYWIAPGAYWLDHLGNAGYAGNPTPLVNLYLAAQQNAYRGAQGGGDNFWTSRFSAGNYDAASGQGYVSVPGYGPVGFGF